MQFSAQQLLDVLERDLRMRQRTYPGRVMTGRMTQLQADYQIGAMSALVEQQRKLADAEKPKELFDGRPDAT